MAEFKGISNIVNCDDVQFFPKKQGAGWDILIKMELLTPLGKVLDQNFDEEQVVRLGIDICNALTLCKSKNIVHSDIMQQNILVSNYGQYKLADFGIAKIAEKTSCGTKTGTYNYMAPEVYNNQPYGSAADIYSLGMVLYWMLNERRTPFLILPPQTPTWDEMENALRRRFQGEPLPAPMHGSEKLKEIVLKACAYRPEDRYTDAEQMCADLKKILVQEDSKTIEVSQMAEFSEAFEENVETDCLGCKSQVENSDGKVTKSAKSGGKKGIFIILVLCTVIGIVGMIGILAKAVIVDDIVASKNEENYQEENTALKDGSGNDGGLTEESQIDINIGDIYVFGTYEQDNDQSNGTEDIEWQVLEKDDTKILVISKYALDCQPYNIDYEDVTWETCTLRDWLNDEFFNIAFSDSEKAMIPTVTVPYDENLYNDTESFYDARDKVFLLSLVEINKYLDSDDVRTCEATVYAQMQGAYVNSSNGNCWCWLRSPGISQDFAAGVDTFGGLNVYGNYVNGDNCAVRPALWIELEP